jgi:uncharacterized membrane protein
MIGPVGGNLHNRLLKYLDSIRTSFWFIPSSLVVMAILLAKLLLACDEYLQKNHELNDLIAFLYQTSPESNRSILTVIASSMMTVTSIAFSITVVALSLASSQFGPRLIRNFMADKGTQVVLGVFTAIFIYCLLILQATKSGNAQIFIPGLSAYFAVFLAFVGVAVLIYFIHHVAQAIQADNVVDDVYCQLVANAEPWFDAANSHSEERDDVSSENAVKKPAQLPLAEQYKFNKTCHTTDDGYLQAVNIKRLLSTSKEHAVAVNVDVKPGDFLMPNSVLFTLYYDHDDALPCEAELRACFMFGAKRTPIQDPEFAIHQLVEIAIRALSPGINDPYTAITCVDKLGAFLCRVSAREFPSNEHFDSDQVLRVVSKSVTFNDLAEAAFNQIRQYGVSSIAVTIRLVESLYGLSTRCHTHEQIQFVARQTDMIEEYLASATAATYDAYDISSRLSQVKANLTKQALAV